MLALKKQIEFFKAHRDLIQFGDYYCSDDNFIDNRYFSFSLVSLDKSKAIYVAASLKGKEEGRVWKIKGLDDDSLYQVSAREQANVNAIETFKMTGKQLLIQGFLFALHSKDKEKFPKEISSRMFLLEKIK